MSANFTRRVARAHQVDAKKLARGGQVARVFLDGADHLARLKLKPLDPCLDLAVARARTASGIAAR